MGLRSNKFSKWVEKNVGGDICRFDITFLTPKESLDLVEKHTKVKWERGQRFTDFDLMAFKLDKIDRVIKDWDVVADDGTKWPCDKKHKELAFYYNQPTIDDLLDESDRMAQEYEESKGGTEKN